VDDISYYGAPILRKVAVPVEKFDAAFAAEAERLTNLMYEYDGVGLAAPQIGISKRFFVVDISAEGNTPVLFVNPVFDWKSEELETDSEGCISIPKLRGDVERPASVTITAQDVDGNTFTVEQAEGLFARALQHENDHLDGILFVDRVSPMKKTLIAPKLKKMARLYKKQ